MPWERVLHKWKTGKLYSGGNGKQVKNQKQAVAIMLSEKKEAEGGKSEYAAQRKGKLYGKS